MKINRFIIIILLSILLCSISQIIIITKLQKYLSYQTNVEIRNNNLVLLKPSDSDDLLWEIEANGGIAHDYLSPYCNSYHCKIPLVFGGEQRFSLVLKGTTIFSYNYKTGPNRFYCFGGDWKRRICRFRDICFDNTTMTFLSPYPIKTDSPFLVLGARPPPYDKKKDRQNELLINVSKTHTIPKDRIYNKQTTFYASMFHNSHMLWHYLFDFALPLFHTISVFGMNNKKQDVIIPSHNQKPLGKFKGITNSFTNHIWFLKPNQCYKDLIVGITKVKDEEGIEYEFPTNFTYQLLPLVYKEFHIESESTNQNILFINRKKKRVIVNAKEVVNAIQQHFPNFIVKTIFLDDLPMKDQIELTSKSKVIIGAHGSGLSHMAWMNSNSTAIEIFPYHYTCRNWYEKASAVSGVNYYAYHTSFESESFNTTEQQYECFDAFQICGSECEEILKNQDIKLNINSFIKFLKKHI